MVNVSLFANMQQNNGLVGMSRFLKRWSGSDVYPMVVMFADVRTRKHRTDLGDVLKVINSSLVLLS